MKIPIYASNVSVLINANPYESRSSLITILKDLWKKSNGRITPTMLYKATFKKRSLVSESVSPACIENQIELATRFIPDAPEVKQLKTCENMTIDSFVTLTNKIKDKLPSVLQPIFEIEPSSNTENVNVGIIGENNILSQTSGINPENAKKVLKQMEIIKSVPELEQFNHDFTDIKKINENAKMVAEYIENENLEIDTTPFEPIKREQSDNEKILQHFPEGSYIKAPKTVQTIFTKLEGEFCIRGIPDAFIYNSRDELIAVIEIKTRKYKVFSMEELKNRKYDICQISIYNKMFRVPCYLVQKYEKELTIFEIPEETCDSMYGEIVKGLQEAEKEIIGKRLD